MEKKSTEEQMLMFEQPNAEKLVCKYISDGLKLCYAARVKLTQRLPEELRMKEMIAFSLGFDKPPKISIKLSVKDAIEIIHYDYLSDIAQKEILRKFSCDVSHALLLQYGRAWTLCKRAQMLIIQTSPASEGLNFLDEILYPHEDAVLQAIGLYPPEALKSFFMNRTCLSDTVLEKLIMKLPSAYSKDVLLEYSTTEQMSPEIQKKIIENLDLDDARSLLIKAWLIYGNQPCQEALKFLDK